MQLLGDEFIIVQQLSRSAFTSFFELLSKNVVDGPEDAFVDDAGSH